MDGIGDLNQPIIVSSEQLCQYLTAAEAIAQKKNKRIRHSIPGIKKRKRSRTPPEQMTSDDEAEYVEQEQRVDERMMEDDPDYQHASTESTSSG